MNAAILTAIAALGAAALTAMASLGVVALQESRRNRSEGEAALHRAIATVLARSASILLKAGTMRTAVEQRSGLGEGLDIALRIRKPLDHFEFHDWLGQDWTPLNVAWAEVWMRGDQQAIRLVNDVVARSAEVLEIGQVPRHRSRWVRIWIWFRGDTTSRDMPRAHRERVQHLANARRELGDYARQKFGREPVTLFAGAADPRRTQDDDQPTEGEMGEMNAPALSGDSESEIVAMLIDEARSQIALKAANSDSHDGKALAFLGAAVAAAIALVTLHNLGTAAAQAASTLLGIYWWIPLVGLGTAIAAFIVTVANRKFYLGPAPDVFYEERIRDTVKAARIALLSDLNFALGENEKPLRWKRISVLVGEAALGLSILLMIVLGVVLH